MLDKNNREVMTTISLRIRGKKNPSPLYVRLSNGRENDFLTKTKLLLNPKDWDNKKESFKQTMGVLNLDESIKTKVQNLKDDLFKNYNLDNMANIIINQNWLENTSNKLLGFSNVKTQNKIPLNSLVFYTDYAEWWLKTKASNWITVKGKPLDQTAIRHYNSFLKIWKRFEGDNKIKIEDLDSSVIYEFVNFMIEEEDYASSTTKRHVKRLRFFITRSKKDGAKINETYDDSVHIASDDTVLKPYLNFGEINTIYNHDFSDNDYFDNIRDTFIIGLWTGLRATDLQERLDIANFEEEYIRIKTQKTGKWVVLPQHPQIKHILNKRLGNLPTRVHKNDFNIEIKKICKICGITNKIEGSLFDGNIKRTIKGTYEKYKLVSSHICRRSFATNLYGKVPNHVIMAVGGWSSEKMMLHYIKKTSKEYADVVKQKWDELFIEQSKYITQNT